VDRKCTFSKITAEAQLRNDLKRELTQAERDGLIVPDEDRPHIFWDCITVNSCVHDVYRSFWGGNVTINKKRFPNGERYGDNRGYSPVYAN
jgi:hypothetical protein